jgi:hypothetical protein
VTKNPKRNFVLKLLEATNGKSLIIICSILALLLLTVSIFGPTLAATWTSDDYAIVYGIYGNPTQSFIQSLSRSPNGIITPHRLFTYWVLGIGNAFGPAQAHALQVALHALCALLFANLVWRLFRSIMLAVLSAFLFILAPWVSQPVIWWSATCAIISTALILVAAHFYLSAISDRIAGESMFSQSLSGRRVFWLFVACLAAFLALCFYDLWIAGFLLFFGIWVVHDSGKLTHPVHWKQAAADLSTIATPFILWCIWVLLIGPRSNDDSDFPSRLNLSLYRIPLTFLSSHLRVANWFASGGGADGPDWLALWKMGVEALSAPVELALFGLGGLLALLAIASFAYGTAYVESDKRANPDTDRQDSCLEQFPWRILLFSWMLFLASRLALLLQGGISLSSRFNYGAGMAVSLGAAAVVGWTWHRWLKGSIILKSAAVVGFFISITLMALATAGRSRHIAFVSQAEALTISAVQKTVLDNPDLKTISIIGSPVPEIGEMNYFAEGYLHGFWLSVLLHRLGFNHEVQVISQNSLQTQEAGNVLFVWSDRWPRATLVRR